MGWRRMGRRIGIGLMLGVACLARGPAVGAAESEGYRVLGADRGRVAIVNARGEVEWEAPNRFGVHDIARLPNGNLLFATGLTTIVEMTPEKRVVWQYESRPKPGYDGRVEVHAYERLPDGRTMIAE